LFLDVFNHLVLIEDVIAGGHHVDARSEKEIGNRRRNRKSARHVLSIHHREIDRVLLFQILQTIDKRRTPGFADHIADEKQFHKDMNSKS
jgi:hypothetical protein